MGEIVYENKDTAEAASYRVEIREGGLAIQVKSNLLH